jgi:hypothetical protein
MQHISDLYDYLQDYKDNDFAMRERIIETGADLVDLWPNRTEIMTISSDLKTLYNTGQTIYLEKEKTP